MMAYVTVAREAANPLSLERIHNFMVDFVFSYILYLW